MRLLCKGDPKREKGPSLNAFDVNDAATPQPDDLRSEFPDINYRCSIRMSYLVNQNRTMIRQNQFVDAKAGALLAVVGIFAFKGPVDITTLTISNPVEACYLAAILTAIVFTVASIFPRYPGKRGRKLRAEAETWSWPSLSAVDLDDARMRGLPNVASLEQLFASVSHSNADMARIILLKFQLLRLGFVFAVIALGIVVYLVLAT